MSFVEMSQEDQTHWIIFVAKRKLDKFDLEAEREGSAVKRHTVLRSAWGKGTIKSRRGRKDAEAAIERRTVKGYYERSV
jgi:hypothetical protein